MILLRWLRDTDPDDVCLSRCSSTVPNCVQGVPHVKGCIRYGSISDARRWVDLAIHRAAANGLAAA